MGLLKRASVTFLVSREENRDPGVGSVQDGVKGEAGCAGNAVQGFGTRGLALV